MKIRHYVFLMIGLVAILIHGFAAKVILTGLFTWSTPHLVLFNLSLDLLVVSFIAAGVYPLRHWFRGANEPAYSRYVVLIAVVVTTVVATVEISVNNSHRDNLVVRLQAGNSAEKLSAAQSLAETGYQRAVPALKKALNDRDPSVRLWVTRALGNTESRDAAEPLAMALNDSDPEIRLAAIASLERLWDKRREKSFVPALVNRLEREDMDERYRSVRVRMEQREYESVDELHALSVQEHQLASLAEVSVAIRHDTARLLVKIGGPEVSSTLLSALKRGDVATVAGAYVFFIRLGEPGSESELIIALKKHGNQKMAEVFLNSRNPKLVDAAQQWADSHGYKVKTQPRAPAVSWGENSL